MQTESRGLIRRTIIREAPATGRRLLMAFLLVAGPAGPAALAQPPAGEIPRPELAEMEPHVKLQLEEARAELDRSLAAPAAEATAALASRLGRMGQRDQADDHTEPAAACYRRAIGLAPEELRWHYLLGLLEQREGRRREAIRSFERALTIAPDDPATRIRLADALRADGQLAQAEELYRGLLGSGASRAAALHGLGRIASERGEHLRAAALYEEALADQPSATSLHFLLGITYRRLGETDKARPHLENRGSADVAFADPLLAELSALASGSAASLQRGYYAAFSGDPEPAIREYRQAVAADPDNPEARRSLAGALRKNGDYAAAIEQLRELVRIDPNPAGAHFSLAETLELDGAGDQALTHYRRAVELAPDFRTFRLELALALARAGSMAEAASHLRRLVGVDPYDVVARLQLGSVLIQTGEAQAAREQFEAVIAGDASPDQRSFAHRGLGRLLAAAGAVGEAIAELRRAVGLEPDDPSARLSLANLLGRSGRYDEAAASFRGLLELDPDNEQARLGEATALVLTGRFAEAVDRLDEGLERMPGNSGLENTLARLLAAAPAAELRDGERALALASGLFERLPTLEHAETLAMALAESGRFEEAVGWQRQIVGEAERLAEPELVARARAALADYEAGRAYRLP